jgi:hypothetical protein
MTLIGMSQKNIDVLESQKSEWRENTRQRWSAASVRSGSWIADALAIQQSHGRSSETLQLAIALMYYHAETPAGREPPPTRTKPEESPSSFAKLADDDAYPGSYKYLAEVEQGLARVGGDLDNICQFWLSMSEMCQKFVKKAEVSITQAEAFAVAWRTHQRGLAVAIKSIAKSCDVITVEPSRPHLRQPRRRGHHRCRIFILLTGIVILLCLVAQAFGSDNYLYSLPEYRKTLVAYYVTAFAYWQHFLPSTAREYLTQRR